ncbi:hypothetical protein [Herbidospora sp. RD11066]
MGDDPTTKTIRDGVKRRPGKQRRVFRTEKARARLALTCDQFSAPAAGAAAAAAAIEIPG